MTRPPFKAGDLAYFAVDFTHDSDDPVVVGVMIKQASAAQITLARSGPAGLLVYKVRDGEPTAPTIAGPAFWRTEREAVEAYSHRAAAYLNQARRGVTTWERRVAWAAGQLHPTPPCGICPAYPCIGHPT